MSKLIVHPRSGRYAIHIRRGGLAQLGEGADALAAEKSIGRVMVVSDENVWTLYGATALSALREGHYEAEALVLPPGEGTKSLEALGEVYAAFARHGLRRDGLAIALGGGVIGDLCGFAAATYMRGIRCLQAPTTLLAQVDSSVGGKTAINLPQGKNLAGAFHQPAAVLIDPDTLKTLPPREMRSGRAEVIKYGAIRSESFFQRLYEAPDAEEIILACCKYKAELVEADELDQGERIILNFGHTFGHAIEHLGGFARFNHGEAVAMGMVIAAEIGEKKGITAPGCAERLRALLAHYGLETECPYTPAQLLPSLRGDKKGEGEGLHMVFLRRIGKACAAWVSFAELEELLAEE